MIQISDHFGYKRIIRFTLPTIGMMVFTSLYTIVDGLFVSNYVGKTAFAAVNLIFPYAILFAVLGFVTGSGGSALAAKTLGEGNKKLANSYFSLLTYISIAMGVVCGLAGQIFLRPVAVFLGAEGEMLDLCIKYGRIILLGIPMLTLQYHFPPFMIAAEKPGLNLKATIAAGLMNVLLDALMVGVLGWDVSGAAWATIISATVGCLIPLIWFSCSDKGLLYLGRTKWDGKAVGLSFLNGLSEFISNVAINLVAILYNWQLLRMVGENGVAAYGVVLYVAFVFQSIYYGLDFGISPVVSYHYGAGNKSELKSLFRKCLTVLSVTAVVLTGTSLLLSGQLAGIFVGYDQELMSMTKRAFSLFAISFLVCFVNLFASSWFTALNNGLVSGTIAFSRMFLFQVLAVLILPEFLGIDGIWLAMPVAEIFTLAVSLGFSFALRKRYSF